MSQALETYLDRVMIYADCPESKAEKVRDELKDHILKKIECLEKSGMPREDAVFKAIEEHGNPKVVGYGLRRFRWLDVRVHGTARGFVAIGPKAKGFIAIGASSYGIIAFGAFAVGVIAIGGASIGLLSLGGAALGLIVWGGAAGGVLAIGGLAAGIVSAGGSAAGLWVIGAATSKSLYSSNTAPQIAMNILSQFGPRFFTIFAISYIASIASLLAFMSLMMRRECARITRRDPKLAEP